MSARTVFPQKPTPLMLGASFLLTARRALRAVAGAAACARGRPGGIDRARVRPGGPGARARRAVPGVPRGRGRGAAPRGAGGAIAARARDGDAGGGGGGARVRDREGEGENTPTRARRAAALERTVLHLLPGRALAEDLAEVPLELPEGLVRRHRAVPGARGRASRAAPEVFPASRPPRDDDARDDRGAALSTPPPPDGRRRSGRCPPRAIRRARARPDLARGAIETNAGRDARVAVRRGTPRVPAAPRGGARTEAKSRRGSRAENLDK